jgi:hypothetical protein
MPGRHLVVNALVNTWLTGASASVMAPKYCRFPAARSLPEAHAGGGGCPAVAAPPYRPEGEGASMTPGFRADCWIEPGTDLAYPLAYTAYRRTREAQEKWLPRHQTVDAQIDRYVWRRWRLAAAHDVDVILTFRSGVPPRVRRIVREVLRNIARGAPAAAAIRHVARRFGLRQGQARAFITAGIGFELRMRDSAD